MQSWQRDCTRARGDSPGRWHDLPAPCRGGDVVCCYARCVKRGNTSVSINIEVWVKKSLLNRLVSAIRRRRHYSSMWRWIATVSPASSHGADPQVKKSLLAEASFIPSVPRRSGEDNVHNQPIAGFTGFIAPPAHGRFNFTFKHIRRLCGQDFHVIDTSIGRNVEFHPYTPFNT